MDGVVTRPALEPPVEDSKHRIIVTDGGGAARQEVGHAVGRWGSERGSVVRALNVRGGAAADEGRGDQFVQLCIIFPLVNN